jgi:hypothetical protein
MRPPLRLALPWVAILMFTAGFHLARGAPIDAAIFFFVGVAVATDAVVRHPSTRHIAAPRPSRLSLLLVGALVGAALIVAPVHAGLDLVVVTAVGIALVPLVWPTPGGGGALARGSAREVSRARPVLRTAVRRSAVRRSAVLWGAIVVVTCCWELGVYLAGRSSEAAAYAFPPLSDLIEPLIAGPVGRTVFVLLWVGAGIGLLRRGART